MKERRQFNPGVAVSGIIDKARLRLFTAFSSLNLVSKPLQKHEVVVLSSGISKVTNVWAIRRLATAVV